MFEGDWIPKRNLSISLCLSPQVRHVSGLTENYYMGAILQVLNHTCALRSAINSSEHFCKIFN